MSFHDSELSKFRTKFLKFPEIPAENSVIPGNSCREFLGWQILSGPDQCRQQECQCTECFHSTP